MSPLRVRVEGDLVRVGVPGVVITTARPALAAELEEILFHLPSGGVCAAIVIDPCPAMLLDIVIIEQPFTRIGGDTDVPLGIRPAMLAYVVVEIVDYLIYRSFVR